MIASATGSPENKSPIPVARGVENDAQHVWDQVVLHYREEVTKLTPKRDEDATRALIRTRESHVGKEKGNRDGKKVFEKKMKRKRDMREAPVRCLLEADIQNLRAQTQVSNAESESV